MIKKFSDRPVENWLHECPVLSEVMRMEPTFWQNRQLRPFSTVIRALPCTAEDVADAAARLDRFSSYISCVFPDTASQGGIIESPLRSIPEMHRSIEKRYSITVPGTLFIKLDSHLPISGSIKARGGIYEVLKVAEDIALDSGLLKKSDNYELLNREHFRNLFSSYSIAVGSTGNLGLSIGIISAKLGFQVTVHMSADAKQWKKDLLRSRGVTVIEHNADYSVAVAEGRRQAEGNPMCHFVDDEDSLDLFLGYAVAAERLKMQLSDQQIVVDENHPLVVYIPCGVGGGPGGVTFGLKLAFGDNVHCFFCEPTSSPALLTGLATGFHEHISAADLGIINSTIADGLAVSRPSGLVCKMMENILAGVFTVADREMYELLAILHLSEKINLEPSAIVGFSGFARTGNLPGKIPIREKNLTDVTHLVWATGGSMVPGQVWGEYFKQGLNLLINEDKHAL